MMSKRSNVGDSPFQTETSTRNHTCSEVVTDGAERIVLEHLPEVAGLSPVLLCVDVGDKLDALAEGQVGPVGPVGIVEIVGVEQSMEHAGLVFAHVMSDIHFCGSRMVTRHIGPMRCSNTIVAKGGCFARSRHDDRDANLDGVVEE